MSGEGVSIAAESPRDPENASMIAALDAQMRALYGDIEEERHALQPNRLAELEAVFLTARLGGRAAGCGALVTLPGGELEIKRMWTEPTARRRGVARAVLAALLSAAQARGAQTVVLETGVLQGDAIALYRSEGFVECPPFAGYEAHPDSVFMKKRLEVGAGKESAA